MIKNNKEFIWSEKYRPDTISDVIISDEFKLIFQKFIADKQIPNLIFAGTAGLGKTTTALALTNDADCDTMFINGSKENSIDTIRNSVTRFATALSISGKKKVVIIDEADRLTANAQDALKSFLEEVSDNCTFIFCTNHLYRFEDPIISRFTVINFKYSNADKQKLAANFFKRCCQILDSENVEYDKKVVAELVKKLVPDCRKILNELQLYSKLGAIDVGLLSKINGPDLKELINFIRDKDFGSIRKWAGSSIDLEVGIYKRLYEELYSELSPSSIPQMVVTLGKYQYQSAFAADFELNLLACLIEIMVEASFK